MAAMVRIPVAMPCGELMDDSMISRYGGRMAQEPKAAHGSPWLAGAWHQRGPQLVPNHVHLHSELVLVTSGRMAIRIAGSTFAATASHIIIIPAGVPHDQHDRGPWRCTCVLFSHGAGILADAPRVVPIAGDRRLLRWIADLVGMVDAGESDVADALLAATLLRIASHERPRPPAELAPIAAALRFMEERMQRTVAGEEVARAAGISVSHLGALFRARFGCGPLQWLQGLRLGRAGALLRNPYATMSEVASACGYSDLNYFNRHFRRYHGLPPDRWRRNALKQRTFESQGPSRAHQRAHRRGA
jgi:AraC-like DNA-binding protein